MHELVVVTLTVILLTVTYGWIYPRYGGDNLNRIAFIDLLLMAGLLGLVSGLYSEQDLDFSLLFFDTNWWIFTIVAGGLIEMPLFLRYARKRNIALMSKPGKIYWVEGVSEREVVESLSDTKYNRLRSRTARLWLIGAFGTAVVLTYVSAFVTQNKLQSYMTIIGFLATIFLYLAIRSSVRLIADAPDELLDERQLAVRNRAYVSAYRFLAVPVLILLTMLMFGPDVELFPDDDSSAVDGTTLGIATLMLASALPSIFVALRDRGE